MAVDEEQIRMFVWDRDDQNPLLSPEDIELIIALSGDVLERAVALGWAVIGGYYAQMIDIEESGSVRRLSQLYKNAERQHKIWDDKAAMIEVIISANTVRVPPVGFAILSEPTDWENMVSMFRPNEPVNVRMFPLYRMPAVL